MSKDLLLDLSFLTEAERDLINSVISKDAQVRKAEQSRISSLRKELADLKESGLPEEELESKNEKYCARCQTYFGLIFNRGDYCPRCELRVCKVCRVNDIDEGWICTLCNKVREVKAQSGAWFFQGHKEKNGNLFGSMLVRQSLRRLPASQSKGIKQEPSNPFIEDEEEPSLEPSNPFSEEFTGGSTERLSGQADLNSKESEGNAVHKMGYQYSDESDSDHRSDDESLEDHHDTVADRTLSKGESDSSESLDSDPDETYESSADELSPVPTRVTEIALQAEPVNTTERKERSGGNVVRQGLGKDIEYQFGISKDTQDVRNRPPNLNKETESGGNDIQKQVIRHTKSDERLVSKPTQKARSRPGSLSLDEDMSYVSAPRFNIPSKRRQYSSSEDSEVQDKKGGFEKHRSKSEEHLIKSEGRLKMNKPSADVIVHSTRVGTKDQDQNISGSLEDIFETAERQPSGALTDKIQGKYEGVGTSSFQPSSDDTSLKGKTAGDAAAQNDDNLEVTTQEDIVSEERGIAVESSPDVPTEGFSVDNNAPRVDSDVNELTPEDGTYDEETGRKESSLVVDSLFDQRELDHQQLDVKSRNIESPTTDSERNGAIENACEAAEGESGDDENIEALSVLSRVKNWERKSNEDRFGAGVVLSRSNAEVKVKEDDNQRGKTLGDKYKVTLNSGGNAEKNYADVEERQTQDISPVVNASMEGLPSVYEDQSKPVSRDHSHSPEVMQTSVGLGNELQQRSYDDIGLDESNEGETVHDELPTEDVSGETSLNLENTEMILEQESYEKSNLDNINPGEVMYYDFPSQDLKKSEIELQQESPEDESSNNANPDEAMMQDEFPSGGSTSQASLLLERSEIESPEESYGDTSSGVVNVNEAMLDRLPPGDITSQASLLLERSEIESPEESYGDTSSGVAKLDEAMQDNFPSGDTTLETSLHLENSGMELQESYDDTSSDQLNPDTEVPGMSVHFEQEKTGTSPLHSEHDDAQNSEEEKGEHQDVEIHPNLDVSATNQDTSPEARDTEIIQPTNEEDPTSPESQINAMRAFSEAFVTTSLGLKGSESHKDPDSSKDQDTREDHGYREESGPYEDDNISMDLGTREDRGYLEDQGTREYRGYLEDQGTRDDRGYLEDQGTREDRGYLEDQGTREDRGYYDSQFDPQKRGYHEEQDPRDDRGYHAESEGPDSRRSSDLHYEGFHADNESMISETSGYGTPSASEDTSSKRTPSISGDEGMNTSREEARRLPSETSPVIVTTKVVDEGDNNSFRNASLDVSFSKYESGLVNRKLKDQFSFGSRESTVSYYSNSGGEVYEETAPVIVTTEVDDEGDNSFRNASITDYDEDLDVSFSKYESGLGNRKLKDQLSLGSRESIVSYYSNAGGEVYGKYPVSGEVLFGVKYDPKIQEFQIQIHKARGITAVDKKSNTSDPYVKTYLLPDRSRTGKRKSKVKKNTINPVFDEILTYKITYDDLLQRTLWFAIWNHDSFGHNDFLGEVLVAIDQYHQSGFSLEDPEPQWYDLCERQAEDPQFSYNGEIVFSLKYVPPSALAATKKKKKKKKVGEEKGELHVNIVEASDLMAKDSNGFSDPFCKSYLLPDKSKKTKQKTAVVKKSLNPKWNYHFVYDNVTYEELMDRVLELTVWDFDRGSSNEFLGGVRLGLGTGLKEWDDSNSEEQAAWNKMLNNQNDWNQFRLTLREHMGSHKTDHFRRIELLEAAKNAIPVLKAKSCN